MHIAHRDKFLFTDLFLQMGLRDKNFNAVSCEYANRSRHTRGGREEARHYYEVIVNEP